MTSARKRIEKLDQRIAGLTRQIQLHERKWSNAKDQESRDYWDRELQRFYRDRADLEYQRNRLELMRRKRMSRT